MVHIHYSIDLSVFAHEEGGKVVIVTANALDCPDFEIASICLNRVWVNFTLDFGEVFYILT